MILVFLQIVPSKQGLGRAPSPPPLSRCSHRYLIELSFGFTWKFSEWRKLCSAQDSSHVCPILWRFTVWCLRQSRITFPEAVNIVHPTFCPTGTGWTRRGSSPRRDALIFGFNFFAYLSITWFLLSSAPLHRRFITANNQYLRPRPIYILRVNIQLGRSVPTGHNNLQLYELKPIGLQVSRRNFMKLRTKLLPRERRRWGGGKKAASSSAGERAVH